MLTYSQKKYLLIIYQLGQNGNTVSSVDVSKLLNVSKVSTSKMTQTLIDMGYILKEPYGKISLTKQGLTVASQLHTSNIIIYNFFKNILNISEKNSYNDTINIVSQLSNETVSKLTQYSLEYAKI